MANPLRSHSSTLIISLSQVRKKYSAPLLAWCRVWAAWRPGARKGGEPGASVELRGGFESQLSQLFDEDEQTLYLRAG